MQNETDGLLPGELSSNDLGEPQACPFPKKVAVPGTSFKGVQGQKSSAPEHTLSHCSLVEANLAHASLQVTTACEADFSKANLTGTNFGPFYKPKPYKKWRKGGRGYRSIAVPKERRKGKHTGARIGHTPNIKLRTRVAGRNNKARVAFVSNVEKRSNLSGSTFISTTMPGAIFRGANLRNCVFNKAKAWCANFSGADARSATFIGTDLEHANLRGLDARGAVFRAARLAEADLSWADLRSAKFTGVKSLKNVKLVGTRLTTDGANTLLRVAASLGVRLDLSKATISQNDKTTPKTRASKTRESGSSPTGPARKKGKKKPCGTINVLPKRLKAEARSRSAMRASARRGRYWGC